MRMVVVFIAMVLTFNQAAFAAPSAKMIALMQKAEAGDPESQLSLAASYEQGEGGFKKDFNEAVKWYQKAAESGNPTAQGIVGWFYQNGQGVPRDPKAAMEWYRKAAEQGDPFGQLDLAVLLDEGVDVPVNKAEAVKWYQKAADQNVSRAQLNLGVMYREGDGVEKDLHKAWDLLNTVRFTARDKEAQWRARNVLDKIKHELGVDRPDGIGRFAYPEWDVLQKAVRKK